MFELPVVIGLLLVLIILAVAVQAVLLRTTVFEWERGLEYASGRLIGVVGPGVYWRLRPTSVINKVDLRPTIAVVPGQEMLSADGVTLKASLVARYRVTDPQLTVNDAADYAGELYIALQIALREVVGSRAIEDVVAARAEIGPQVTERAASAASRVGLFARVVEARQQGLAMLERARAERLRSAIWRTQRGSSTRVRRSFSYDCSSISPRPVAKRSCSAPTVRSFRRA